ncbi:MAG: hypothetical protein AB7P76_01500 [Candidatus Melainabacteria bacterium]
MGFRIHKSRWLVSLLTFALTTSSMTALIAADPLGFQQTDASQADALETAANGGSTLDPTLVDRLNLAHHVVVQPTLPGNPSVMWTPVQLDNGQIEVELLQDAGFMDTHEQLGLTHFVYAGYLYEQVASRLARRGENALASEVYALATHANQMAAHLRDAAAIEFNGIPTTDLPHLQVRTQLMDSLAALRQDTLYLVDRNARGLILHQSHTADSPVYGATMSAFVDQLDRVRHSALANTHPQTLQLLEQQAEDLMRLAAHLQVRWESTFETQGSAPVASRMHIFAFQSAGPQPLIDAYTLQRTLSMH